MTFELMQELEGARRRELRMCLGASALLHLLMVLTFLYTPTSHQSVQLPGVVSVELVAAPPGPAPVAKARPKPKPKPAKVLLPKEPTRTAEPLPASKQKAKPKPQPLEYEDVLDQLRAESGEVAPQPKAVARATTAAAGARGAPVSPEVAAWVRDARIHVRRAWVLAPGFRTEPLETHVSVKLDAAGHVQGEPRVTRRSGNPWYDESVVRAVQKASPLPAPPEAGEWPFVFQPQDAL